MKKFSYLLLMASFITMIPEKASSQCNYSNYSSIWTGPGDWLKIILASDNNEYVVGDSIKLCLSAQNWGTFPIELTFPYEREATFSIWQADSLIWDNIPATEPPDTHSYDLGFLQYIQIDTSLDSGIYLEPGNYIVKGSLTALPDDELLIPLLITAATDPDTTWISLPDTTGWLGDTMTIPLRIQNGSNVLASDFSITYKSDVIQILDVSVENTLADGWFIAYNTINDGVDTLLISMATAMDTINGSGIMANIQIAITTDSLFINHTAGLNFVSALLNGNETNTLDGSITITGTPSLYGDVSLDSSINAYDASLVLQYVVGLIELTEEQQIRAEVDSSDTITSNDASLILQYSVQLIDCFPIEGCPSPTVAGNRTILLSTESVDDTVVLRIGIDDLSNIVSSQMVLQFPNWLQPISITATENLAGYLLSSDLDNLDSNRVNLAFASAQGSNNVGGDVIIITSQVVAQPSGGQIEMASAILNNGAIQITIVNNSLNINDSKVVPTAYSLKQNYPNPFNPITTIEYSLPISENVNITIYNLLGQQIITLINEWSDAGTYRITWQANDLPSGTYFYQIQTDQFTKTRKMVLMK